MIKVYLATFVLVMTFSYVQLNRCDLWIVKYYSFSIFLVLGYNHLQNKNSKYHIWSQRVKCCVVSISVNRSKMVNETELPRISEHCAVRLDNFIIIIGGESDGLVLPTREIWTYNLYTDKWEKHVIPKKREAPRSLHYAVAVSIESIIYTFGGMCTHEHIEINELWTLSRTETGDFTWTFIKYQSDKESPSPRDQHTGWEYARKLWVFGGEGPSPEIYLNDYGDIEYGCYHRNNQLLCYDPDIRKWTNPKCFGEVPSLDQPIVVLSSERKFGSSEDIIKNWDILMTSFSLICTLSHGCRFKLAGFTQHYAVGIL